MAELVIPCPSWKQLKPWLLRFLAVVLAIWVAFMVREIWLPLTLAFLIALILDPVVDRMERRGFGRALSASIIFGGFILVLAAGLYLTVPPIVSQTGQLQAQVAKAVPDQSPRGIDRALAEQGVSPSLRPFLSAIVNNAQASYKRSSGAISGRLFDYASNLIWLVIVPIVAFYALRDFHVILGKLLLLVSERKRALVQSAVSEVTAIFARYMRGLLIVSTLNGIATWLLLWILGVPSSLLLGLIAGVLYSVPYIGAIITVILVMLVSFLAGGVNFMLVVLAANVVLHQIIFDQIVTPRILGGQVGLHPILAIVALLAGNALFGLIGMILAVPVAACIQIGILALIPKLKQEIEMPDNVHETARIGEETKDQQIKSDATAELHSSVGDAVAAIEERAAKEQEVLAKRERRKTSPAADTGH